MSISKSPRKTSDAYGEELMAFYKGEASEEIIERDDHYIESSSMWGSSYLWDYPKWPPYEKRAVKFVRGKILDVGCGAGRHSLYFQRKGFDILGIDNSPLAVKLCRLRGVKKAKCLSIEDIGKLRPARFDTLLMMGNNFGLFGSFQKARRFLRGMDQIPSPQARIVAQTMNPPLTQNLFHLSYHKRNREKGRMVGQVRIRVRFRNFVGSWINYLFVSEKEMRGILEGTGWEIEKIIPSKGAGYFAVIRKRLPE